MWACRGVGVVVVAVMGGAMAAPGSQGWQFLSNGNSLGYGNNNNGYNTNNNNKVYNTNNNNNQGYTTRHGYTHTTNGLSTGSSSSSQQAGSSSQQVKVSPEYYAAAQQYPNTAGYYGLYEASPDYAHEAYVPAAWHGTGSGSPAAYGTDSSPALSALALLGFLYFLNLIQDVLQDNSGRRRRSLSAPGMEGRGMEEHKEKEEEGHYITSYLEEEPVKGGNRMDEEEEERKEEVTGNSRAEPRAFSFLEDFFIWLPQTLGMRKRQMIDRLSRDKKPMAITSFISSRVKMISSIMSFLQDPSPSRIRRAWQDPEADEPVEGKTFAESFLSPSLESFVPLMTEVLKGYSPFVSWPVGEGRALSQDIADIPVTVEEEGEGERDARGGVRVRRRRHSSTAMNAWYGELRGRNKETGAGVGSVAAKAMSLLGGSDVAQQAMKQEAGPALLELSRGLGGSSPHCLQRVLCRLTSHANQLSLIPRMALRMLSSNFVGESEDAVKAGLRGENCTQTFSECDADSTLGKT